MNIMLLLLLLLLGFVKYTFLKGLREVLGGTFLCMCFIYYVSKNLILLLSVIL